jgi:GNAT superfamily N-acetyltransferase
MTTNTAGQSTFRSPIEHTAVHVQAATTDDLSLLTGWNARLGRHLGHEPDPAVLRAGVCAILAEPALGRYRIARLAGRPAGMIELKTLFDEWANRPLVWIDNTFVLPEQRCRGVGRALFARAVTLARAEGTTCVRLFVAAGNYQGRAAWLALGLRPVGSILQFDLAEAEMGGDGPAPVSGEWGIG